MGFGFADVMVAVEHGFAVWWGTPFRGPRGKIFVGADWSLVVMVRNDEDG